MTRIPLSEVLTRLAGIETKTADIYARAAGATALPGAKELFAELSTLERGHATRIDEARKTLAVDASATVDFDEFLEKELSNPWPTVTEHNIHVFAIRAERAAARLYQALCDQVKEAPIGKLFSALLSEEKEHRSRIDTWFDGIDMSRPFRQT